MRFVEAITKEADGVEVRVEFLTRDYLLNATAVNARIVRPSDFASLEQNRYINYAGEGYDDLLTLYNRYGQVPQQMIYDEFGEEQPLARGLPVTPYLDDNYQLRVSAFRIVVVNKRSSKVEFDPAAITLITEEGHQLRSLRRQEIMETNHWSRAGRRLGPSRFAAAPRWYGTYSPDAYLKERILDDTLLQTGTVYSDARVDGIVVFPKVAPAAQYSSLRLVLPGIVVFRGVNAARDVDFEFNFLLRK